MTFTSRSAMVTCSGLVSSEAAWKRSSTRGDARCGLEGQKAVARRACCCILATRRRRPCGDGGPGQSLLSVRRRSEQGDGRHWLPHERLAQAIVHRHRKKRLIVPVARMLLASHRATSRISTSLDFFEQQQAAAAATHMPSLSVAADRQDHCKFGSSTKLVRLQLRLIHPPTY